MTRRTKPRCSNAALPAATLRTPCAAPRPPGGILDPIEPNRRPIGVALSGGGVRATLTGLGTVQLLADVGLLGDVRHLTSVSGGSILGALIASQWDAMRADNFSRASLDRHVSEPLVAVLTTQSIQRQLYNQAWKTLSPKHSRTDLLAQRLADTLLGEQKLDELPTGTWFEINTTNLTTAARFRFTRDIVGDYITGSGSTNSRNLRLADVVAWSCAVPGAFNSTVLDHLELPCQREVGAPELIDGGAYDNLGAEAFKSRDELRNLFCIIANAGGSFEPSPRVARVPIVGELWRANTVLYQQVANLRSRGLFTTFNSQDPDALQGCIFNLRSLQPKAGSGRFEEFSALNRIQSDVEIAGLAIYPTDLHKVETSDAQRLMYRGWWLSGALLSAYAPDLVDECPKYVGIG